MSNVQNEWGRPTGSDSGANLSQSADDLSIDVCISYPEKGARKKHLFSSSKALVDTLLAWKSQGISDIMLTWGVTQNDIIRKVGIQIREAGVDYQIPSRPQEGNYPVSKVCPKCGHTEFKKRRPEKWIAFSWDRVCTICDTRYTPPTPVWAGIVFILVGLPLAAFGLFGVLVGLARGNPLPLACEGPLGLLGILAIIHGLRTLIRPGNA